MNSLDQHVITAVVKWLGDGESVWFCTVIRSWGSAPRQPGSLMACNQNGQLVGSLSGGCVEDDLVARLTAGDLARDRAEYKIYGDNDEDSLRFQLPCGGTLGVLVEPLTGKDLDQFVSIDEMLLERKAFSRHQTWGPAKYHHEAVDRLCAPVVELNQSGVPERLTQWFGPELQVFIIGVCDVSRALAEFSLALGYRVSVCDPRGDAHSEWSVDGAAFYKLMPDDAVWQYADSPDTAIVAVSHDPRIDDMGLMAAVECRAFYIGAMGSARSSDKRRLRLSELGISDEKIARIRMPVGLAIGSKTPAEIAVSILAEIIAIRSRSSVNLKAG